MTITRRHFSLGVASLGLAGLTPGAAWSQAAALATVKPGKPFAGTEIKILCVVATQFRAHEARAAAFTDATGITVKYTYVPFASMRDALTAEMVGGTGGYDMVTVMDQWVPSLTNLMDPMDQRITDKKIDLKRYPEAFLNLGQVGGKQLACRRVRMCSCCSIARICSRRTTCSRPRHGTRW